MPFPPHHATIPAMTPAAPKLTEAHTAALITAIVRQLSARLPKFLAQGDAGQRVVIHIAPGHRSAKIEWPPEVDDVKP
jgi:hypothetical protein